MPGVPRELAEHALNIDPRARPIRQPLRCFSEPNRKAMLAEIHRLQEAGFIKEVKEATWVANPVMVPKKHTEILRMCVDFTPLNKHCPNLPLASNRPNYRLDGRLRTSFLPGRILWL